MLDPDVAARVDGAAAQVRGARAWARGAVAFQNAAKHLRPLLVDRGVALGFAPGGELARLLVFRFAGSTIDDIEVITEPDGFAELAIEDLP